MSDKSSEPKICPNCHYPAVENYCAKCGQENHLHKDTFGGLIMHFAGHYLHYDSKFWKTLRALWFSPGLLTTAYWEEKRMRYIAPISLYIFVSFIYFFTVSLLPEDSGHHFVSVNNTQSQKMIDLKINTKDPTKLSGQASDSIKHQLKEAKKKSLLDNFDIDIAKIAQKHPDFNKYLNEEMNHFIPKIFFFLIPLMGLILRVMFIKRQNLFYVNHVIYSLHYHSFWFSTWTVAELLSLLVGDNIVLILLLVVNTAYMVVALRNVYNTRWLKSIMYTLTIGVIYALFLILAVVALMFIVLVRA